MWSLCLVSAPLLVGYLLISVYGAVIYFFIFGFFTLHLDIDMIVLFYSDKFLPLCSSFTVLCPVWLAVCWPLQFMNFGNILQNKLLFIAQASIKCFCCCTYTPTRVPFGNSSVWLKSWHLCCHIRIKFFSVALFWSYCF